MFDRFQVVAAVPAGRRRYLEILLPYLQAQKGILDRCDLWCNTTDANDLMYLRQAVDNDPFFRLVEARIPINGIHSVYHFFCYCVDPDTIYIRFDDDICWVAPNAAETLARFRLEHPEPPLILANTVNNGICSYLHQRIGCIPPDEGFCTYDSFGELGWRSGPFARLAHEAFLGKLAANQLSKYLFPPWFAWEYERVSINCICWLGKDFSQFGGEVDANDEQWLTTEYPASVGRPNAICGTALVSHFAFGPQRPWLEAHTDLLHRYRSLATKPGERLATTLSIPAPSI